MTPFAQAAAWSGFRAAVSLPAWIIGLSFLGVGSIARDAGHPLGAAMLATALIFASPAQLILYTSLASGGLVVAAAIAVGFSAIRLLPMTLSVMAYLRRPGQSILRQWGLAHMVAATTWVEGITRLPLMEPDQRIPYFATFSLTCLTISVVTTAVGFLLVGALPLPLAAGLMSLTPIYFTVAMTGAASRIGDWLAIGFGLGLAPVVALLVGTDFDIIVTGLLGGSIAYGVDRLVRNRKAAS